VLAWRACSERLTSGTDDGFSQANGILGNEIIQDEGFMLWPIRLCPLMYLMYLAAVAWESETGAGNHRDEYG